MLCPTCDNVNLAMTDRQGIEIDYCPKCRGIWLDRGELDRLIEHAERSSTSPAPARPRSTARIHRADIRRSRSPHRDHPHATTAVTRSPQASEVVARRIVRFLIGPAPRHLPGRADFP